VLAVGAYVAGLVVVRFVRTPSREIAMMVASGVVILGASLHDVALENGLLPAAHDFAIQHAAWSSAVIFTFLFVSRFIDALDTSEALTAELGARVAEKAAEIEDNHARLRVLQGEQAVADERERILGEIHDGMGGQLISALAMVRNREGGPEETAHAIQAALDDMRLMIHSLDEVEGDLGTALGSLRERIGRRLEHAGLTLEWRIADTPPPAGFGPEAALQVMRIVREAITNVIKHAETRTISVSTSVEGEGPERVVVVEVADDGRGFGEGGGGGGRGLTHMRSRAQRIGAELTIVPTSEGTRVRLSLPAPDPST
jgi:signal transduction histidine kinase